MVKTRREMPLMKSNIYLWSSPRIIVVFIASSTAERVRVLPSRPLFQSSVSVPQTWPSLAPHFLSAFSLRLDVSAFRWSYPVTHAWWTGICYWAIFCALFTCCRALSRSGFWMRGKDCEMHPLSAWFPGWILHVFVCCFDILYGFLKVTFQKAHAPSKAEKIYMCS